MVKLKSTDKTNSDHTTKAATFGS